MWYKTRSVEVSLLAHLLGEWQTNTICAAVLVVRLAGLSAVYSRVATTTLVTETESLSTRPPTGSRIV